MADWLRGLWSSSPLPSGRRGGHTFRDLDISGNARVHNGDIHGNVTYYAANSQNQDIVHWLQPPDSTVDHIEARNKHEPGTGAWFLNSTEYRDWLRGPQRALWLHGKAGCGKTILCSSAIYDVEEYVRHSKEEFAMAYFYFSFSNQKKQDYFSLVLSLTAQLVRDRDPPKDLLAAFRGDQRNVHLLEPILVQLLDEKEWTFIMIDALDECPEDDDRRHGALQGLRRLVGLSSRVKLLGTSRDLVDIAEFMKKWPIVSVAADSDKVNMDIEVYLVANIEGDRRLRKLPKHTKDEIRMSISGKANGMFRWATCQLGELQRLKIHRPESITKALRDLPATLDVTYDRLLEFIDDNDRKDARTALTWLVFAQRPLRLEELVEACITDIDRSPAVDEDSRTALYSIVEVLSSLVEVTSVERCGSYTETGPPRSTIKLAHFTVKEYLTSDRIRNPRLQYFKLEESHSHETILRVCVAYLLHLQELTNLDSESDDKAPTPLISYAAAFWDEHLIRARMETEEQMNSCRYIELLSDNATRDIWLRLRVEESWRDKSTEALYWASLLGLETTVQHLCTHGADVNHIAGRYGTALQAACARGHTRVVEILLHEGALPDLQAGEWGTALKAACRKGHLEILSLLIMAGADVNAVGGKYGSALHTAAAGKHLGTMERLLDAGADVNITGGPFYSPLCESVRRKDRRGAAFLLKRGAKITGIKNVPELEFLRRTIEENTIDFGNLANELIKQIRMQRDALNNGTGERRRTLPGYNSAYDAFQAELVGKPTPLSPERLRLLLNPAGGRSTIASRPAHADNSDDSDDYVSANEY